MNYKYHIILRIDTCPRDLGTELARDMERVCVISVIGVNEDFHCVNYQTKTKTWLIITLQNR